MSLTFTRLLGLCFIQVIFGTSLKATPPRVEKTWQSEVASVQSTLDEHARELTIVTGQVKQLQDRPLSPSLNSNIPNIVNIYCQSDRATESPKGTHEPFLKMDINVLNEVFTNAYGKDVRNVANIIKFCEILDVHLQAEVLSIVYKQMVNLQHLDNYQIFQLAFKLKQLIDSHPEITKLYDIKAELPSAVRTIIFENNNVCVKTRFFGKAEYLFTEKENVIYDKDRRYVFTNKTSRLAGTQGVWLFEPDQDARYFSIKNKLYDEYLFAGEDSSAYDDSRRRTFTWRAKTKFATAEWQLEPDQNASVIYFKQRFIREYLYPFGGADYDKSRRLVLTWRSKDKKGLDSSSTKQYQWIIETCPL